MNENAKNISWLADTLSGEINRMCVTDDLAELDTMAQHATKNIEKLRRVRHEEMKRGKEAAGCTATS